MSEYIDHALFIDQEESLTGLSTVKGNGREGLQRKPMKHGAGEWKPVRAIGKTKLPEEMFFEWEAIESIAEFVAILTTAANACGLLGILRDGSAR